MSIINWDEDVTPDLTEKDAKKIFLALLTRKITDKWLGNIKRNSPPSVDFNAPYIELRKTLGEAAVLLRIGYKCPPRYRSTRQVPTHVVTEMSMNAKASFVQDDFVELNLVLVEAMAVFNSIDPKNIDD